MDNDIKETDLSLGNHDIKNKCNDVICQHEHRGVLSSLNKQQHSVTIEIIAAII